MLEADLMLVLNKELQKVREGSETQFYKVKYLPFRAVSTLLNKKTIAIFTIPRLFNMFI